MRVRLSAIRPVPSEPPVPDTIRPWRLAAPEQTGLVRTPAGYGTNVYNLGVLGWILVTGRFPYAVTEGRDLGLRIVGDGLPRLGEADLAAYRPPYRAQIRFVIATATAADPAQRYGSLEELAREAALLAAGHSPDRNGITNDDTQLIGRAPVKRRLEALIEDARGGVFRVCLLQGEPGVGKSRLWREVCDKERMRVWEGSSNSPVGAARRQEEFWFTHKSAQSGAIPFGAIGALVEALLQQSVPADSAVDALRSATPRVRRTLGRISRSAERIVAEVGYGRDEEVMRPDDADAVADRIARVLADLLDRIGTAIIAFDDLQWQDDRSRSVLRSLVKLAPGGVALILLQRTETVPAFSADPAGDAVIPVKITLTGLNRDESATLVRRIVSGRASTVVRERVLANLEEIVDHAQGNPLALFSLTEASITDRTIPGRLSRDSMLLTLALARLELVDEDTNTLLRVLALLAPPVPEETMTTVDLPLFHRKDRWELALFRARRALLLDRETLRFSHDTVEHAARSSALEDPVVVRAVTAALLADVERRDDREVFALARLLVPDPVTDTLRTGAVVNPEVARRVLARAVRIAADRSAPGDTLEFAEAALRWFGEGDIGPDGSAGPDGSGGSNTADGPGSSDSSDRAERVALHLLAHEAAFLLDDLERMSRHFRQIQRWGTVLHLNDARRLWITVCYSRSSFDGALRVGLNALRELGTPMPFDPTPEECAAARREVRALKRRRVVRRLERADRSRDPATHLINSICIRIMVPILIFKPILYPFFIRTILDRSLRYGPTPTTAIAYVVWEMMLADEGAPPRQLFLMGRNALRFSARGDPDETTRTTIEIATLIFSEPWGRDYHEVYRELGSLHNDAVRAGNHEWAAHAAQLHCMGALLAGEPLPALYPEMNVFLNRIRDLGIERTARAFGKYVQAAECLLGRTADPVTLTGSIQSEAATVAACRAAGDHSGLFGTFNIKGILSVYDGRPDRALRYFRHASEHRAFVSSLPDVAYHWFYRGYAAWRQGDSQEARRITAMFRRWSREVPENHRHRYLFLRAERAAHRGRTAVAARLLHRSAETALHREYLHEAALAYERRGEILREIGRNGESLAALHNALSLYSRWGAVPAMERVRRRLGWSESPGAYSPVLGERRFLRNLLEPSGMDTALRITLDELARVTSPEEAFLHTRNTLTDECTVYRVRTGQGYDGTVERIPDDSLPRNLFRESEGRTIIRSPDAWTVVLTAVFVRPSGRAPYSPTVTARVENTLALAATVLAFQLRSTVDQEADREIESVRSVLLSTRQNQEILMSSLQVALVLVDRDGTVLVANEAAEPFLTGDTSGDGVTAPAARVLHREIVAALEEGGDSGSGRPGEREILFRDMVLRITTDDAESMRAVTIEDITKLREQEKQLRRQQQQLVLSDRMASLGMLAATTAHEVGNPNHILQLNLESLLVTLGAIRSKSPDLLNALEATERFARQGLEASHRIESVVQGVKEFGRGGREDRWELVSPERIVRTAARFTRILAAQYTDAFQVVAPDGYPSIRVIPGLMEQALINLVKNACEALPDRTRLVEISLRFNAEGKEVLFLVSDQGRGIESSGLERPEEPFAGGAEKPDGTGLGLAIVRSILERHEARLRYYATPEFATVAEIALSVAEVGGIVLPGASRAEDVVHET